ncbi:glycogen debranching enzyme N-terminal domain-containing protein, partial [bacterium]|nr:glycogen debranching enzyme N-terminal domain-containing protein [bacterium]
MSFRRNLFCFQQSSRIATGFFQNDIEKFHHSTKLKNMSLTFDKSITQNFDEALRREWLETNGLGGWASSTIAGAHTRRYHGLLVTATHPPVGRMVLLSKLDETIAL